MKLFFSALLATFPAHLILIFYHSNNAWRGVQMENTLAMNIFLVFQFVNNAGNENETNYGNLYCILNEIEDIFFFL
jgi:hypothetical protein